MNSVNEEKRGSEVEGTLDGKLVVVPAKYEWLLAPSYVAEEQAPAATKRVVLRRSTLTRAERMRGRPVHPDSAPPDTQEEDG